MSNLSFIEKSKFEQILGMSSGYVAQFSNRTFAELVHDSTGRDIFDVKYNYVSGSKAHRLRAFWQKEDNRTVAKLMTDILDYCSLQGPLEPECRRIIARLRDETHGTAAKTSEQPARKHVITPFKSLVRIERRVL